jgi:hypothetical protein
MDVGTINRAIISGSWSNDDLASMIDAVKFARSRLATQAKFSMKVGSKVRFNSQKLGMPVDGTITKMAIKYATVSTDRGLWKVPMNMLEAV